MPIKLTGIAPIARAISTAGGISLDELDADFMLRKFPGVFAAGEMLDWEAPTGGYLLQASFATGITAGKGALKWLDSNPPKGTAYKVPMSVAISVIRPRTPKLAATTQTIVQPP